MPSPHRTPQDAPDTPRPPLDRVVILMPTYNERENLPNADKIADALRKLAAY